MKSWIEFWDSGPAIYVSDRHKQLHAEAIAHDIMRYVPAADAIVLDYGCGEALYAEAVAARCGRLILCEAAPNVRRALARRLERVPNISVLAPDGVAALVGGSLDLVVANSLVQYLSREELSSLLEVWRSKLKAGGTLVVADVIRPDTGPHVDAAALLRFAWRGRFLLPALAGLARTALSDYGRLRRNAGFSTYREAEMLALLAAHGFAAERVRPNFGHNQARMTFRAVPAPNPRL